MTAIRSRTTRAEPARSGDEGRVFAYPALARVATPIGVGLLLLGRREDDLGGTGGAVRVGVLGHEDGGQVVRSLVAGRDEGGDGAAAAGRRGERVAVLVVTQDVGHRDTRAVDRV